MTRQSKQINKQLQNELIKTTKRKNIHIIDNLDGTFDVEELDIYDKDSPGKETIDNEPQIDPHEEILCGLTEYCVMNGWHWFDNVTYNDFIEFMGKK